MEKLDKETSKAWGGGTVMDAPLVAQPPLSPELSEKLDDIFTYHPPTTEQVLLYEMLRRQAKNFALAIIACCPASADRTAAIRKTREALMTANASIALDGRSL